MTQFSAFYYIPINLLYAVIVVAALFGLLRLLDYLMGVKFNRDIRQTILKHPLATAVYFGMRFIAVAVLLGLLLGAG